MHLCLQVDINELHTAVKPNLQCIVRSLRRPLRLKRSKAPGKSWKMVGACAIAPLQPDLQALEQSKATIATVSEHMMFTACELGLKQHVVILKGMHVGVPTAPLTDGRAAC